MKRNGLFFALGLLFVTFFGYSQSNLSNGLMAYYPFNGNANDESGNGNNGTVHGAILTIDRFGSNNHAFNFNGIDNYIEIPHSTSMSPIASISISAWVKTNQSGGMASIIAKWDGGLNWNHTQSYDFYTRLGAIGESLNADGGQDNSNWGSTTINNGSWHHVVMTSDNADRFIRIYIDGVLDMEYGINGNIIYQTTGHVLIGVDDMINNVNWFQGTIDWLNPLLTGHFFQKGLELFPHYCHPG